MGWGLAHRYYHSERVEFEISGCKLAKEEKDVKDVCVEVWESGGKESE